MKELLIKYIKGEASPEETEKAIRWIYSSEKNMQEYLCLRKLYDISLWNGTGMEEGKVRRLPRLRKAAFSVMKYAAAAIVCITISYLYLERRDESPEILSVNSSDGKSTEVVLSDSSRVWLGPNSSLEFPVRFSGKSRNVLLEGMAYFDISHIESSPFTVSSGAYDIRVLGTKFSVTSNKESGFFETMLLEGKVEISDSLSRSIMLKPSERATVQDGKLVKGSFLPSEYDKIRNGIMSFSDKTVESMIPKIEMCYGINLDVRNKELLHKRYSGNFRISEGIEHMLNTLQIDCSFTYSYNSTRDTIIIR